MGISVLFILTAHCSVGLQTKVFPKFPILPGDAKNCSPESFAHRADAPPLGYRASRPPYPPEY